MRLRANVLSKIGIILGQKVSKLAHCGQRAVAERVRVAKPQERCGMKPNSLKNYARSNMA